MHKYIIAVVIALLCSSVLFSETLSGELKGMVTDSEGNPLKGANVTLNEPGIQVGTDSGGYYSVSNIPYGHYHITYSKTGYIAKTIEIEIQSEHIVKDIVLENSLIQTATIDVTGSFEVQEISQSTFSLSTLGPRELIQERSHNLSSTIDNIPGVNTLSTGTGIGKPVLRGMTSNSVLIIHDGVKQESQQWGDEHSPEVSTYDIDRIEILRGPASLLYGADGIGGVVNILSKPLLYSSGFKKIFYGNLDLDGFSVNKEGTGNLTIGTGFRNMGLKGHLGFRKSGNVRTPDGNLLVNTLISGVSDTIHGGILSNSGTEEVEGGFSFGYRNSFGYIEAGFETFNREVRMHEPEPQYTGSQKLNTNQFVLNGNIRLSNKFHLEPVFSFQTQNRKEFENDEDKNADNPGLFWKLKTFQGDARLHNHLSESVSGTFGLSVNYMDNQSLGIEKLIPDFNSASYGIYAFEKYNAGKFTFSIGGRYDTKNMNIGYTVMEKDIEGNPVKVINPEKISLNSFSGSAGIVFRPAGGIDIFSNIGRGWRAPSEFELYVDGVHEGTGRVERGIKTQNTNAGTVPETSLNIDFGIRARLKIFSAEVSLFNNVLNDFIYPSPAGTIDSSSGLPVFLISQDRAFFRGFEYSFQFQPLDFLLLTLSGDYVFTKNKSSDSPLPFTPPMKNIIGIKIQKSSIGNIYNPYLRFSVKFVSPQNDVDPLETKTDGYALINIGAGLDLVLSNTAASLDLSVENLGDIKYIDHLSRYKSFAMNPGRSFNLKISVPFQFGN